MSTLGQMMDVQQVEGAGWGKNAAVHDGLVVSIHLAQGHMSPLFLCLELWWVHL